MFKKLALLLSGKRASGADQPRTAYLVIVRVRDSNADYRDFATLSPENRDFATLSPENRDFATLSPENRDFATLSPLSRFSPGQKHQER